MKILVNLITLCCIAFQLNAQKVIEKEITTSADRIKVEFKFAQDIAIKTWDKSTVYLKAEVSINDGEFDNYFDLKIDNSSSMLDIESSYGDLFEKRKKEKGSNRKNNWGPCNNMDINANYTLYLPKNAKLLVKSISGNVASENYQGELEIDIISGDIDIKKYQGDLNLKTISGTIDIHIAKSKLKAETVTGMIYSDKELEFDQGKNRIVGSKVTGTFGDTKSELALQTVSGDIFIRKQ
ncbi:hypothetical protein D1818_15565 [Aquimarina sp. BL5]|uniref:DUF4097 family beta strand repeat-containing protein n=1 Tax=Aquimarina sp. BL5 TaxID=1714860 RepID=UPI000E504681|nr:DUF4097 family beta strand repeat-containing protein [Aquimarina sp. BL5]AXT52184.1 hypothetical protein D1818_15565 [Aquimarina sp. BL5]RKN07704.1 hypothetical protein D7036_07255 [Aquimarina sp. BL5]